MKRSMMCMVLLTLFLLVLLLLVLVYITLNDRKLGQIPSAASQFSPTRVSAQNERPPVPTGVEMGPKTGRRYIVVGGGGFLGGWIVHHLIQRGEEPSMIRVIDISPSHNVNVPFFNVDISSNPQHVIDAFSAPWPQYTTPLTVFHTAASIRFYERHPHLLSRSANVNVIGTKNVINAARAVGASILIYTSSASVSVRRSRFWLKPWESEPKFFVQVINDNTLFPKHHHHFFSNYAASKAEAEKIVRAADKTPTSTNHLLLRTGCIRPGNGIFGPGDMLCHAYLRRPTNPTWVSNTLQSFIYVENCVSAHLCYEQRLIELEQQQQQQQQQHPDIGGDAFTVTDPGPPATFGDLYTIIETLTAGQTHFTHLSPTAMLLLSHLIELYYCTREIVGSRFPLLQRIMPPILGDLINLQPSLFALTQVHLIFDDSRARLPPEKGGLGYRGAWSTIQGVYRTFDLHKAGFNNSHNAGTGGVTLGFKLLSR